MENGPIVPCNNIEQTTTLCSDNENTNKSANSIPLEYFFGSKLRDLFNSHHGLAQRPSKVCKAMLHAHLGSLSLSLSS